MMAAVFALALVQQGTASPPTPTPTPTPVQRDTVAWRPCQVAIDTVGHYGRQVEVRPGETDLFAGGGVKAHCQGTNSTLSADSVAWYAGVGRLDMMGTAQIRDTSIWLDAETIHYFLRQERLDAHKNVVAKNPGTGSVLRGPNLTYYRVARGIRDTAEMYATSRPTIEYHATPDSGEPYVIVGDRVRFKGNDRVWAGGSVTVDRSDLSAKGDSLLLDETAGFGLLAGHPEVDGKGARSYRLVGRRIEFGLQGREIRLIKALGAGQVTGTDWRLTADTIHLAVTNHKLQQVFAWSTTAAPTTPAAGGKNTAARPDSAQPRAVSRQHTIEADSLALDLPDEVLTEARSYGHARSTSIADTTRPTERDWMVGDTIVAHWTHVPDSAGTGAAAKLERIVASGHARAFTHLHNDRDTTTHTPSLNYSRGDKIDIRLKPGSDRIDEVLVTGRADGLQLEPEPVDTTKKKTAGDTTKAGVRKPRKP